MCGLALRLIKHYAMKSVEVEVQIHHLLIHSPGEGVTHIPSACGSESRNLTEPLKRSVFKMRIYEFNVFSSEMSKTAW